MSDIVYSEKGPTVGVSAHGSSERSDANEESSVRVGISEGILKGSCSAYNGGGEETSDDNTDSPIDTVIRRILALLIQRVA
jgi:hypothetical protein